MGNNFDTARIDRKDRVEKVQALCREQNFDVAIFNSPENIYYLAGLDYEGYFCLHTLVVPANGQPILFARSIETPTIVRQAVDVQLVSYADNADIPAIIAGKLREVVGDTGRIALQKNSAFNSAIEGPLRAALPSAEFGDISGVAEQMRLVKSPYEVEQVKLAATVSEQMVAAGIEAARKGAKENEIAAEVYRAMILAGGQSPGFPPFIRSVERLNEPHTSWTNRVYEEGDTFLIELSGCVERYHAPMARSGVVGRASEAARKLSEISVKAHDAALAAIKPGALASQVHAAWSAYLEGAKVAPRLQHCGYTVGISFPPTWTGGPGVNSLSGANPLKIEEGMVFHMITWIADDSGNEIFLSDCVLVEQTGGIFLTNTPRELAEV